MCPHECRSAFLDAKGVLKAEVSLSDKCADIVYDAGKNQRKRFKKTL